MRIRHCSVIAQSCISRRGERREAESRKKIRPNRCHKLNRGGRVGAERGRGPKGSPNSPFDEVQLEDHQVRRRKAGRGSPGASVQ